MRTPLALNYPRTGFDACKWIAKSLADKRTSTESVLVGFAGNVRLRFFRFSKHRKNQLSDKHTTLKTLGNDRAIHTSRTLNGRGPIRLTREIYIGMCLAVKI